jgi:hypothetical protein
MVINLETVIKIYYLDTIISIKDLTIGLFRIPTDELMVCLILAIGYLNNWIEEKESSELLEKSPKKN